MVAPPLREGGFQKKNNFPNERCFPAPHGPWHILLGTGTRGSFEGEAGRKAPSPAGHPWEISVSVPARSICWGHFPRLQKRLVPFLPAFRLFPPSPSDRRLPPYARSQQDIIPLENRQRMFAHFAGRG